MYLGSVDNVSYVSTLPWRQGRRRSAQPGGRGCGRAGSGCAQCARSADLERVLSTAPTMRGRLAEEADDDGDDGDGDSGAGLFERAGLAERSAAIPLGRGGSAGAASLPGVAARGGHGGGLAASRGRGGPAPARGTTCTSVTRVVARCPGAMLMPMAVVRRCGSTAATGTAATACWACWATRSTVAAGCDVGSVRRGLAEAGGGSGGDIGRLQASGSQG